MPVLADVSGFAAGQASAGATFTVEVGWELVLNNQFVAIDVVRSGQQTGSFAQGLGRTASFMMDTRSLLRVNLRANIGVFATDNSSVAFGSAFIDPFFHFGDGVDTNLYHLVLSPGMGNTPPVPEPNSLAMLALGLMVLAARRLPRASASRTG